MDDVGRQLNTLDWLEAGAAELDATVGIRLLTFHPDERTGHQRQSLLGTLEVRRVEAHPFRRRELLGVVRLTGPVGEPTMTLEQAAEALLDQLARQP